MKFAFWKRKKSEGEESVIHKDPVYMPSWFVGLAQAGVAFLYLGAISFFSSESQEALYGKLDALTGSMLYFGVIILSALALGLIFLSYPLFLYQRNMPRRALSSVGYTFLWMLLIIALFVAMIARNSTIAPTVF